MTDEPSGIASVAIAIASYIPAICRSTHAHTLGICTQYLLQTVTSNTDPIELLTIHEKERRAPLLHYPVKQLCVCVHCIYYS